MLLRLPLIALAALPSSEAHFLDCINNFCKRATCKCEGTWLMDPTSWAELDDPTAQLKPMKSPVLMDVYGTEEEGPNSVRASLQMSNVLSFVAEAKKGSFCDKEVKLTSGMLSPRLLPVTAMAQNEKRITRLLLNDLSLWDCDRSGGKLTIASPIASISFTRHVPETEEPEPQFLEA